MPSHFTNPFPPKLPATTGKKWIYDGMFHTSVFCLLMNKKNQEMKQHDLEHSHTMHDTESANIVHNWRVIRKFYLESFKIILLLFIFYYYIKEILLRKF